LVDYEFFEARQQQLLYENQANRVLGCMLASQSKAEILPHNFRQTFVGLLLRQVELELDALFFL